MNSKQEWKVALEQAPNDPVLRLAYADWLEEQGERLEACKVRQQAGAGTLIFSLWHPEWGEKRVGEWTKLQHLKSHVEGKRREYFTGQLRVGYTAHGKTVPVSELVVLVEWRANPMEITRLRYEPEMKL